MRILVAAIVLTACVGWDTLAHDSWISRGNHCNAAGEWCCGAGDCFIVPKERVMTTGEGYVVIHGPLAGVGPQFHEAVPFTEAQPSPERFAPLFLRTAAFHVIPAGRDGAARFGRSRIIPAEILARPQRIGAECHLRSFAKQFGR
jgi:hypothetical protein